MVKDVEQVVVALRDLLLRLELQLANVSHVELHDVADANIPPDRVHVELVVEERPLLLRTLHRRKLTPTNSVTGSNFGALLHQEAATGDDCNPRLNHDLVKHFWIGFDLEFALLRQ